MDLDKPVSSLASLFVIHSFCSMDLDDALTSSSAFSTVDVIIASRSDLLVMIVVI